MKKSLFFLSFLIGKGMSRQKDKAIIKTCFKQRNGLLFSRKSAQMRGYNHRFSRKITQIRGEIINFRENLFRYGVQSSILKKNNSDTGVDYQFSGKFVQIRDTINEKQKKEAFVGVRLMKNA